MKISASLCLFLLFLSLSSISISRAQEGDAVDFDFIYGRITGGLNFDGWGVFSDQEPVWEGNAGWGKKGLFSLELKDRYKKFYNRTFELPTISANLSLKKNWRTSLDGLDHTRIKYRDEGSTRETPYGEYKILKHRSTSYDFSLTTSYLNKDGKIQIPKRLLNYSYYRGILVNKGQLNLTGVYFQRGSKRDSRRLRIYDTGIRFYESSENPNRENNLDIHTVYGFSDSWNCALSGTYGHIISKSLYSVSTSDSILNDTIFYYPPTYSDRVTNTRNKWEWRLEITGLLSSKFLSTAGYHLNYTQSTYKGELTRPNNPKRTSKSTSEELTHFLCLEWVYLSSNPNLSVKRILDDYSDYYGHLLNKKQVKWENNLSLEKKEYISEYSTYLESERRYRKRKTKIRNLTYQSELVYGFTERVNTFFSLTGTKLTHKIDLQNPYHQLDLNYEFGLTLCTYSYDKNYREDISWEKVSDFDYIFGPLLSKGQSQFEILFHPRGYSGRWTSSSENLLQFKELEFLKNGLWQIKARVKSGITDFLQVSFEPTFEISSFRENIYSTTRLDFQLWPNCRLVFSYNHQASGSWGYLFGSWLGSTSSTYNITVRLNLLI